MPATLINVLIILFSAAAIIAVVIFLLRYFLQHQTAWRTSFQQTVLQVRVPKESAEVEAEKEQAHQKGGLKEDIAVAETLYANLYGLRQKTAWRDFFYGVQNYFSLEMVVQEGLIKFFVVCPKNLAEQIEQQIHAQYPYAEVNQISDYNIFTETGQLKSAYLIFKKSI